MKFVCLPYESAGRIMVSPHLPAVVRLQRLESLVAEAPDVLGAVVEPLQMFRKMLKIQPLYLNSRERSVEPLRLTNLCVLG
jgi:hypothetical protein